MIDHHFLLKCDHCGWHGKIDQACIANPCPECGYKYNYQNLLSGTMDELIKWIKERND